MSKKPNIIFILIDDMGWRDTGCYGSSFYETPHIDSLATRGMHFTDAYATCPVSSPTRASVMTGKYPATVGITDWIDMGTFHPLKGKLIDVPYIKSLPRSEYTLAQALRDNGYATWHIGKWHLGGDGSLPEDHGFDVNIGGCHMGCPMPGGYFSPWGVTSLRDIDVPEGTYLTDYLTDCAVDLIADSGDTPFFLNMWYYSVHTPIEAKKEYIEYFKQKAKDMGIDTIDPFEKGEEFPTTDKKGQHITRRKIQSDPEYAAMIKSLDENIGRLITAVDKAGKTEDTLIVFTSDNGGLATAESSPTCNAPLAEGKGWMYEGGTREPLIAVWPGIIDAETSCDVPVTSTDFYPTFLEAAGVSLLPEQHCDGVSILPLLKGEQTIPRDAIFWHYPHYGNQGGTPGSSVRCGNYKLIEFFEDERLELYDVRQDIGEEKNIAEMHPHICAELKARLDSWRDSIEAKIPQLNPDYEE